MIERSLTKRKSDTKTKVVIVRRCCHRPSRCRPHLGTSRGPAAASHDAYLTASSTGKCRAVSRDFRWNWRPAVFDPLPRIAVHIENSPLVGLEASNRKGTIGGRVAATSVAPTEPRAKISKPGIPAERSVVVAKAVGSARTRPRGIFPFRLG